MQTPKFPQTKVGCGEAAKGEPQEGEPPSVLQCSRAYRKEKIWRYNEPNIGQSRPEDNTTESQKLLD